MTSKETTTVAVRELSKGYPVVSVIIPYFKAEAYIEETVRSVEEQNYPAIEIIVVDDGSPVPARAVLGERENLLILRTKNQERSAARNFGFERSSGEYIIFLDADDKLVPGAIEAQLKTLTAQPDAALVFGAARLIDKNSGELKPAHICRPRRDYFLMLLEGNPIASPGAAMIRRDALNETRLWNLSFRQAEDYLLYLQLARRHKLVQHSECVLEYRIHGNNTSQDKEGMLTATLAVLDLFEKETSLSGSERRRLRHGRRRWVHVFRPEDSLRYRLHEMYYRFHAMFGVKW
jgi:glycosyltransferase involved in cell wall biosynthesis